MPKMQEIDNHDVDGMTSPDCGPPKPTIRSRLLLAVNLPLAVLAGVFLAFDYSHSLTARIESKRVALEEEAKTLLPAAVRLRSDGPGDVQDFIDDVCVRMQDTDSPGHHILVQAGGATYQASAHHRESSQMLSAMRRAAGSPDFRTPLGETELIVGSYALQGVSVYVSESLEALHGKARSEVVRRLFGFLLMALVAAAVVNAVLLHIVSKPLERLVGTVQQIGQGQLGAQTGSLRTRELGYLADELNSMSQALAASEKTRQLQLSQAREIQRNLLPNGVSPEGFTVAHLFEPADEVGGDFFDILMLCDRSWLVCLADVSGHGIPAAMNAAMLKTLVTQAAKGLTSPSQILREVNQQFSSMSLEGDFATVFMLRVDARATCLHYASAGHDPGWLLGKGAELRQLPSTGFLLGIDPDAEWEEVAIDLSGIERVLLVTDGVCESSDPAGRLFGREKIGELLKIHRDAPADQVMAQLRQALQHHRGSERQTDDVTAVLIQMGLDANH